MSSILKREPHATYPTIQHGTAIPPGRPTGRGSRSPGARTTASSMSWSPTAQLSECCRGLPQPTTTTAAQHGGRPAHERERVSQSGAVPSTGSLGPDSAQLTDATDAQNGRSQTGMTVWLRRPNPRAHCAQSPQSNCGPLQVDGNLRNRSPSEVACNLPHNMSIQFGSGTLRVRNPTGRL